MAYVDEITIVPAERHVERLAREGRPAETRTSLRTRLLTALLREMAFADRRECRLALAMALADSEASGAGQLGLFGGVVADSAPRTTRAEMKGDPLLEGLRARGGASWARMVAALDDAIGVLRAGGATAAHLDRVGRGRGFLAMRARTMATAMRALDARLARAGVTDDRLAPTLLANAIADADAGSIEGVVGARHLRARWLFHWEPSDLRWWRALDEKLAPRGGGARIVLPSFDRPLQGDRERDPLEVLAEEVASGLDGPPESETIESVLSDLTGISGGESGLLVDSTRVQLMAAGDAVSQAHAAATIVAHAIASGAAIERIVLALPVMDERTLVPLRRALEEADIAVHESRGAPTSHAPVIAGAFLALDAATSLGRLDVARLLRSGWVDPVRITAEEPRSATRRLHSLARMLEASATANGTDPAARLVRTATERRRKQGVAACDGDLADEQMDIAAMNRLVAIFSSVRVAATRVEHVRATRTLWNELGIGARAGRGGLVAFASDLPPRGVARATRHAIARDARAWDALVSALDLYETTAHRVDASDQTIDLAMFRLELVSLLDAATVKPDAGRAAALRILKLSEVGGDELDVLVVLDANEGLLPRESVQDALISEAFAEATKVASQGVYVPRSRGAARSVELVGLAVAAAEAKRVILVHPREDSAGAPLAPSPIVEALERAGVPLAAAGSKPLEKAPREVRLRATRERMREAFFLDPARPRSDVVGDLRASTEVTSLLSFATGGAERTLAVTGLERFARCAFMGYASVVLGARETESRLDLPDAREEGTLIHEALAAAFVATRDLWARRPRSASEIRTRGEAAAALVLDRWQGHAPLRAVVRLRVRDAVRAMLEASIDDEKWDFLLAEQPFGAPSPPTWPPLTFAEENVRLSLRGSIDRVDDAHDGRMLRVIDYKRSKATVVGMASALGETALQVPLYACVAERVLGKETTGAYLPAVARDARLKPSAKVAARLDELVARPANGELAEIERRALSIVGAVRSGTLLPLVASEAECRFCEFSGGCRKPRFAMAALDVEDE